jgi:hypothetical protein
MKGGQDPVSRTEGESVEGHVPGPGGVLHHRDLVYLSADEPGDRGVRVLDLVGRSFCGFVSAHLRLALEVGDHGLGDLGWREAAPALLRWATRTTPGVSRRARWMSKVELASEVGVLVSAMTVPRVG